MADSKVYFSCPNCDKSVSVATEHAGKRGKCPGCGYVFQIPPIGSATVKKCVGISTTHRAIGSKAAPGVEPGGGRKASRIVQCFSCGEQRARDTAEAVGRTGVDCVACQSDLTRVIAPDEREVYREALALSQFGEQLYRLGQFEASREQFEQALQLSPEDPILLINMGNALGEIGWDRFAPETVAAGIPYLKKALALYPDYKRAEHNLRASQEKLAELTHRSAQKPSPRGLQNIALKGFDGPEDSDNLVRELVWLIGNNRKVLAGSAHGHPIVARVSEIGEQLFAVGERYEPGAGLELMRSAYAEVQTRFGSSAADDLDGVWASIAEWVSPR